MSGDFNFYFDKMSYGGNHITKTKSIASFLLLKEKLDLVDIWRIRNPNIKTNTFRQNHFSGFLQRRFSYQIYKVM